MKIVRAMKKRARLQGEIKELKRRADSCLSTLLENDEFKEVFNDLIKEIDKKNNDLITLSDRIMRTNVQHNMFKHIVTLGNLKSYLDFVRELNPREGTEPTYRGLGGDGKEIYKSQWSVKGKNEAVQKIQGEINDTTDQLDDFNARTDIID